MVVFPGGRHGGLSSASWPSLPRRPTHAAGIVRTAACRDPTLAAPGSGGERAGRACGNLSHGRGQSGRLRGRSERKNNSSGISPCGRARRWRGDNSDPRTPSPATPATRAARQVRPVRIARAADGAAASPPRPELRARPGAAASPQPRSRDRGASREVLSPEPPLPVPLRWRFRWFSAARARRFPKLPKTAPRRCL